MITVAPVTLDGAGVRLAPLAPQHADGLRAAASDGELWNLVVTSVPRPADAGAYIARALATSNRLAFAVLDAADGTVLGTTSYHDIVPDVDRVEIGYTWYARRMQRSHLNTRCKLMLLTHAFEVLGCAVVGLRTDGENFASQAAIERLGAHRDGVLRHHAARPNGQPRDTVMYSILRAEWPQVKARLEARLAHYAGSAMRC